MAKSQRPVVMDKLSLVTMVHLSKVGWSQPMTSLDFSGHGVSSSNAK